MVGPSRYKIRWIKWKWICCYTIVVLLIVLMLFVLQILIFLLTISKPNYLEMQKCDQNCKIRTESMKLQDILFNWETFKDFCDDFC
jgi:uncharacterized protein YpmS